MCAHGMPPDFHRAVSRMNRQLPNVMVVNRRGHDRFWIDFQGAAYYCNRAWRWANGNATYSRRCGFATTDFTTAASHPRHTRLNCLLREHGFDDFAEAWCATFYADTMGRPGLPPGIYFPTVVDWLLRGHRFGARHRAARGGLVRAARLLGVGLESA